MLRWGAWRAVLTEPSLVCQHRVGREWMPALPQLSTEARCRPVAPGRGLEWNRPLGSQVQGLRLGLAWPGGSQDRGIFVEVEPEPGRGPRGEAESGVPAGQPGL